MKKLTAIILSILMLAFAVVPVMATETQQTATVSASNAGAVTMNGAMGTAEGWGTTPVAYLDKTFGITGDAQNAKHGEVYLSADYEYVYFFIKIYEAYNDIISDSSYQTFIKAYFGEYGQEEISFWGTAADSYRKNPSVKEGSWNTGEPHEAVGYAKNSRTDEAAGTYTIECKLPIPEAVRNILTDGTFDISICVVQCLGEGKGAYVSDNAAVEEYTKPSEIREDENCTSFVTLPKAKVVTVKEVPVVQRVSENTVNIDGKMEDGEGWSKQPYALFDTLKSRTNHTNDKPSELYISTDGKYLYVFFESAKENWTDAYKDKEGVYFYVSFSDEKVIYTRFRYQTDAADVWQNFEYADASKVELDNAIYKTNDTSEGGLATAEFKIEIPDTDKETLKNGTLDIKIDAFEKEPMTSNSNRGKILHSDFAFKVAKVPVTLPANPIADDTPRYVGAQERVNKTTKDSVTTYTYDVRFLSAIGDYSGYDAVGFDFEWVEKDASATVVCDTVYRSVFANGEKVKAEFYGGQYFFAYTLTGLGMNETYTFKVKSYTRIGNEKNVCEEITVTVTTDGEGNATIS